MSVAQVPRLPGAHRAGFAVVVALHALIGLALLQGLGRTVIESFKPPVDAKLLPAVKPPLDPPSNLPQPKTPRVTPTFMPAPDQFEIKPSVEPTITAGREAAPAGSPSGDAAVTAPVPMPAPPSAPRLAARPAIGDVQACAPQSDDYPLAARRAEAAGVTRLRFTVSAAGSLVRSEVVRSAGPTREHRLLDKVAESKLAGCSFTAGVDENGHPVGGIFEVDYVWKLSY